MSPDELILERFRQLPPEQQQQVLDLVDFLQKNNSPEEVLRRSVKALWSSFGSHITDKDIAEVHDREFLRLIGETGNVSVKQALPHPVSARTRRKCPNCAENIKTEAIACCFCGYGLSDEYYIDCKFCKSRIRKLAIRCKYCHASLNESS